MLDTVRSFAVRWLLEPTKNGPAPPRTRTIRYVICFMPNPTEILSTYDETDRATIYYRPLGHDIVRYDDNKHYDKLGVLAVKIYDNDQYVGYFMYISTQKIALKCDNGEYSEYANVLTNGTVRKYQTQWTSRMQSASEMITATYQKQGCPFEPKAGIDGNAQTYGPDDDGYYSDTAQLTETTEIEIKYASRGGGDSIYVGVKEQKSVSRICVNHRKINKNVVSDWQDISRQYNEPIEESQSDDTITVDPSSTPDYTEYDPDNLNESDGDMGWYVYYGDGMTAEKAGKYAALYKQGNTDTCIISIECE